MFAARPLSDDQAIMWLARGYGEQVLRVFGLQPSNSSELPGALTAVLVTWPILVSKARKRALKIDALLVGILILVNLAGASGLDMVRYFTLVLYVPSLLALLGGIGAAYILEARRTVDDESIWHGPLLAVVMAVTTVSLPFLLDAVL